MQGKILIIEDVKELAELVSLYLSKDGFEPRSVESAEAGFALLGEWKPDLVILDINLPGMDGFEFLQKFRKDNNTPVLIVSARDSDEDLITGLGGGADEFVTKPFSPKVLVARVRAVLRRVRDFEEKPSANLFGFGPFILDYDACLLRRGGERVPLSAREYEVLAFLAKNSGRPWTPDQIYNAVWQTAYGDVTTVAVYIQRLRKKIEEDSARPLYIETVYGMGYRLNPDGRAS
ncbi:MAG: response regulator transcription factor [Treponema sp.]|jgi:two-component system response regulator RegX3|nr:response regulator transcription factor [Treponema sp.]